ncbi:MAG: hypothetical protein RLZZ546_1430 [Bacteroidota bacterium]|jgi:tetratricopeptide (TPR) repeat protein
MKKLLLILFLLNNLKVDAQKVDIDNYRVQYEVANLPEVFIEEDKRTFSVELKGSKAITDQLNLQDLKIYGYKMVEKDGTIRLNISAGDLFQGTSSQSARVVEVKDKAGKVTSKTTYYTYSSTTSGNSSITIMGPMTEAELKKEEEKEKAKMAKKAKKKEEKAEPVNPFLANASNNKVEASSEIKETEKYKKMKFSFLGTNYTHSGSESTNASAALKSYQAGENAAYNNFTKKYPVDIVASSSNIANSMLGYYPQTQTFQKMKILDSDKHPEHNTFKQAIEACKVIFKNLKYDSDLESFKKDFAPVLEYFKGLDAKLGSAEKHEKRLKAAALYNIAMISTVLGDFPTAEAACKKMIAMDQDKDDAEAILEDIEDLMPKLLKHKLSARHVKSMQ